MNKKIKKAKQITNGNEIMQQVKEDVKSDLKVMFNESFLAEEDVKNLIDSTVAFTISSLSKNVNNRKKEVKNEKRFK